MESVNQLQEEITSSFEAKMNHTFFEFLRTEPSYRAVRNICQNYDNQTSINHRSFGSLEKNYYYLVCPCSEDDKNPVYVNGLQSTLISAHWTRQWCNMTALIWHIGRYSLPTGYFDSYSYTHESDTRTLERKKFVINDFLIEGHSWLDYANIAVELESELILSSNSSDTVPKWSNINNTALYNKNYMSPSINPPWYAQSVVDAISRTIVRAYRRKLQRISNSSTHPWKGKGYGGIF